MWIGHGGVLKVPLYGFEGGFIVLFETLGDSSKPAVLFFHAMGVVGRSSEPVASFLCDRYYCIMPTATVYCKGQRYVGKADEVRQVEDFLRSHGVNRLELVVASSLVQTLL